MTVKQLVDALLVCDPGAVVHVEMVAHEWQGRAWLFHASQDDRIRVYVDSDGIVRISGGMKQ